MYFGRITILFVLLVCVTINAVAIKRKPMKTKIKKVSRQNIGSSSCGCQNPLADIFNCGCRGSAIETAIGAIAELAMPGCRGPIIEPALGVIAPFEIAIPGCQTPVIDVPNYRYADPFELNPLGCLFPSIEIPNYGMLPAPVSLPSVEYFTAVELPCGCPGPKCGCRAPAVKLPTCPREYFGPIEVPSCGCQGLQIPVASVIEIPSYAPAQVIPVPTGCRSPIVPACGCQGPCSCAGIPISSCGCQGPCSCAGIPVSSCGCQGPCSCAEYQILSCGCQGSCSCPGIPLSSCGCQGSCGCAGVPMPCGCKGSCGCSSIPMPVGLLPAVEVASCGCGCGLPGCNCGKYLRQVTLPPPFL